MHPRQPQRTAADRGTDQTLAAQHRIEDCIDSVPERCQSRTRHRPAAQLDGGKTHPGAYRHRSEARQEC